MTRYFSYGPTQSTKIHIPEIEITTYLSTNKSFTASIMGVIDTGAAMTCIPLHVAQAIDNGSIRYRYRKVRGVTNLQQELATCYISMQIATCTFEDHEVMILDKEYAVVGRDILNRYSILLDGLNLRWHVRKK